MLDNLPESAFETPNSLYQDLVHPAAKSIGNTVGTIAQFLNTLLLPFKAANDYVEIKYQAFINDLRKKADAIPSENLVSPEISVIGPAIADLRFSLDETDIRSMYLNLLASSIDDRTEHINLRAFVQIIKQLSPFEARLFKYLFERDSIYPAAILTLLCVPTEGYLGQQHFGQRNGTLLTDICFEDATDELLDLALQNYLRLGLIELFKDQKANPLERYSYVESTKTYIEMSSKLHSINDLGLEFNRLDIKKFCFGLTSFGISFFNCCIS